MPGFRGLPPSADGLQPLVSSSRRPELGAALARVALDSDVADAVRAAALDLRW